MLVKFKYEPPTSYWDCNVLVFKASIAIANLKNRNCIILASFPSSFSLVIRLPFLSLSLFPPSPLASLPSTFCSGNPSPQPCMAH